MPHSVFGWDLPPGVTMNDIDRAFGDAEYEPLRCPECSAFLPVTPLETFEREVPEYTGNAYTGDINKILVRVTHGIWICRRCGAQTEWEL